MIDQCGDDLCRVGVSTAARGASGQSRTREYRYRNGGQRGDDAGDQSEADRRPTD